jgi:hypothetical protein
MSQQQEGDFDKTLRYLVDFYVKHQSIPPTKGGLLTGDSGLLTYKFTLGFDR